MQRIQIKQEVKGKTPLRERAKGEDGGVGARERAGGPRPEPDTPQIIANSNQTRACGWVGAAHARPSAPTPVREESQRGAAASGRRPPKVGQSNRVVTPGYR